MLLDLPEAQYIKKIYHPECNAFTGEYPKDHEDIKS